MLSRLRNGALKENRFGIAQLIACPPVGPGCVGDPDVFVLQDRVIDHVLAAVREVEGRAVPAGSEEKARLGPQPACL